MGNTLITIFYSFIVHTKFVTFSWKISRATLKKIKFDENIYLENYFSWDLFYCWIIGKEMT
jgi:hypothetical protein